MFPTQDRAFAHLVDRPLPDFRRVPWIEGPQVAVVVGGLLLTAGAIIANFHGGQTLWEFEWGRGLPVYAPTFLVIAYLSLGLAVWRCYWPLWLTAFAATITVALLFAFVYLPFVLPPLYPALSPLPQVMEQDAATAPAELVECQPPEPEPELAGPPAPVPEIVGPPEPALEFAGPPEDIECDLEEPPLAIGRPNLLWGCLRPAFGSQFLLLGPWLLYLAAAWSAVSTYRRRSTFP